MASKLSYKTGQCLLRQAGTAARRHESSPWHAMQRAALSSSASLRATALNVPTVDQPDIHTHSHAGHDTTTFPSTQPSESPRAHPTTRTSVYLDQTSDYMVKTYVRPPAVMIKGHGCYLEDIERHKYLDFTAGIAVNSLGHCDEGIAKILAEQSLRLVHCSNLYYNEWTGVLSRLLVSRTRELGGMHDAAQAFICNSGSEANEAAIKFCRKVGKQRAAAAAAAATGEAPAPKDEIVTFQGAFHGRTMGSLSGTPKPQYQEPFAPLVPGFVTHGHLNCSAAELEQLITPRTCGVLVEPIQGEGGINVASPSFLRALRRRCNEVGAVLVHDEIQCGLGRTGRIWAHAALPAEDHPDIVTTAKALGNGFPIGATLVNSTVGEAVVTGDHGTTFGGNPLASRVACYVVQKLTRPKMLAGVLEKEQVFRRGLEDLQQQFPDMIMGPHGSEAAAAGILVDGTDGTTTIDGTESAQEAGTAMEENKGIRGRGLILGLQLLTDPSSVITAARDRGLLLVSCGTNTIRFVPPLVITAMEIKLGLSRLGDAMRDVQERNLHAADGESGHAEGDCGPIEGTKGQQEMAPPGR